MKIQKIKFKDKNKKYSTLIGENIIGILRTKIKFLCPNTKKIAIVFDSNVPKKFLKLVKQQLKNYEVIDILFRASEKAKSMQTTLRLKTNALLWKQHLKIKTMSNLNMSVLSIYI